MANDPQLIETSGSDGRQSSEASHAVGYGRPPRHTRFKPGQCGNPKGRPKRQRNVRTVVEGVLGERITIREGNRTRSLTKFDAMVLTMMNAALKGDAKAQASVIALLRSVGMTDEAPEASHSEPLTADDAAVIADYLRRHSAALAPAEPPRGNEQATVGTPPPDAGAAS